MGSGLAEYTMRIALAEVIMRWNIETVREDFDVRRNIAMGPKYGIPLRITGRYIPVTLEIIIRLGKVKKWRLQLHFRKRPK